MAEKKDGYDKEIYFLPIAERENKGAFFGRIVGYDPEILLFIKRYHEEALRYKAYINSPLPNPSVEDLQVMSTCFDVNCFLLDIKYFQRCVSRWLDTIPNRNKAVVAQALMDVISDLAATNAANSIKNTFVKFMYWAKKQFAVCMASRRDNFAPPILFEGTITKYEFYALRIMHRIGCDVLIFNHVSDKSYLQLDYKEKYSKAVYGDANGALPVHYSKVSIDEIQAVNSLRNVETVGQVITNSWLTLPLLEAVLLYKTSRNMAGHYPNMFGVLAGVTTEIEAYKNNLFIWKEKLDKTRKTVLFFDALFTNPTVEETNFFKSTNAVSEDGKLADIVSKLQEPDKRELSAQIQKAFVAYTDSCGQRRGTSKWKNRFLCITCWFRRIQESLFAHWSPSGELPVVVFYGSLNTNLIELLKLLSCMPVDALWITPNKKELHYIEKTYSNLPAHVEQLPSTCEDLPFPKERPRIRIETTAFQASKELDTLLYADVAWLKGKRFTQCNTATLRTTYEEIELYWHEEAKYRPGFEGGKNRITLPNLFAKVCGINSNDVNLYLRKIQCFADTAAICHKEFNFYSYLGDFYKDQYLKLLRNGRIDVDKLRASPDLYQYEYLSEETQMLILDKMQKLITSANRILKQNNPGEIMGTLLNLGQPLLHLIQQHNWVGEVPKFLIVANEKQIPSYQDCVLLAFLNLIGFDIVIFTPTGYNNIEKHINCSVFDTHFIGEYRFDVDISGITRQKNMYAHRAGGFLTKLLGKGLR